MSFQNSTEDSIKKNVETATDDYSENASGSSHYFCREGQILKESENELCIKLNWNGREFMGCLLKENENNPWEPTRKKTIQLKSNYKNYIAKRKEQSKKVKNPDLQNTGLSFREKYPQCFVDSANVIATKFRYGRDRRRDGAGSFSILKQLQNSISGAKQYVNKPFCNEDDSAVTHNVSTTVPEQNSTPPERSGAKKKTSRIRINMNSGGDETKDENVTLLEQQTQNSSSGLKQRGKKLSTHDGTGDTINDKTAVSEQKRGRNFKTKKRSKKSKYNEKEDLVFYEAAESYANYKTNNSTSRDREKKKSSNKNDL